MEDFLKSGAALSDKEIISKIKSGDRIYLRILIERYMPYIINAARNYPYIDREDLIQEGRLAVFSAAESYDEKSAAFSTFVFLCINRAISSFARSFSAKKRVPAELIDSLGETDILSLEDPEKLIIERENFENLKNNIKNVLSETEYKVLIGFLSAKSYGEIAAELNISEKSVDNALSRVRKKLKK